MIPVTNLTMGMKKNMEMKEPSQKVMKVETTSSIIREFTSMMIQDKSFKILTMELILNTTICAKDLSNWQLRGKN